MAEEGKAKKGISPKLVIIIVAVLAVLGVGGYLLNRYVINKTAEEIIEQGTGADVDIQGDGECVSVQTDQGSTDIGTAAEWPSDLPSGIPEFTAGKLTASTKVNTTPANWSIVVSEVTESYVNKYKDSLVANGFAVQSSASIGGGTSLTQLAKGEVIVALTYSSEEKTVSITVSYQE